jgi:hypothetical protein
MGQRKASKQKKGTITRRVGKTWGKKSETK